MSESGRRPNVCVLVLDAVQAAHLPTYGYGRATTPFLDSLAEDATVFERAVSPSGVTVDSVGSFFTGLYPGEHRAGNAGTLEVDVPHLPAHLRARGYRTGVVTCNPFLTPAFGFDDGVDSFDPITVRFDRGMNVREFFTEASDLPKPRRYLRFLREALGREFPWHVGNALQFRFGLFEGEDDGAALATDSSLSFVGESDGEVPWFLYAHYTETHMTKRGGLPYTIPPAARRVFLPEGVPEDVTLRDTGPRADYDERTLDVHQRLYDGAIRYLDDQIRAVVEGLRERGEWEDTLLIVTADHGECVGERGLLGHGVLYEPGVHVPLVVRTPEWMEPPSADTGKRVSTVGLYRTIAAATGESPDHARGVDVRHESETATLVQEYSNTWDWSRYGGLSSGEMAFYRGETKLLELESGTELYDLTDDPGETEDLAESRPDCREEMRDGLRACLEGLDLASGDGMDRDFDADTETRLRDLGYID
jgi:arylsulfatase A-like enzyme